MIIVGGFSFELALTLIPKLATRLYVVVIENRPGLPQICLTYQFIAATVWAELLASHLS